MSDDKSNTFGRQDTLKKWKVESIKNLSKSFLSCEITPQLCFSQETKQWTLYIWWPSSKVIFWTCIMRGGGGAFYNLPLRFSLYLCFCFAVQVTLSWSVCSKVSWWGTEGGEPQQDEELYETGFFIFSRERSFLESVNTQECQPKMQLLKCHFYILFCHSWCEKDQLWSYESFKQLILWLMPVLKKYE